MPSNMTYMNIIITGASRGIGYEVVKILCKHRQNHIVAIARNGKSLKELITECQKANPEAKLTPYEFDLHQFDFYPFIIQRLEAILHSCDVLIHNAGKLTNKPFDKLGQEEFDRMFNINIKAPYFFTQAVLPIMNKGAHIVTIGSLGGIQGSKKFPGLAAYSASKAALTIFTESLAEELKEREISANCLALGGVQTSMFERAFPGIHANQSPEKIAQFIADFSVTGSKYFNGKVIPVATAIQ